MSEEDEIYDLRRALKSFYDVLSLPQTELFNTDFDPSKYLRCLVRIDKKLTTSGKLIGFKVFEGISQIYYVCGNREETIDNIDVVNLENENEVAVCLLDWWETEALAEINELVKKKCKKIISEALLKEG